MLFKKLLRGSLQSLEGIQKYVKLRPEKCELFQRQVRYVGRLVSSEGVNIDPRDTEAVQSLNTKMPERAGDVRRLLGFLSYYCSYVEDFSRIALQSSQRQTQWVNGVAEKNKHQGLSAVQLST